VIDASLMERIRGTITAFGSPPSPDRPWVVAFSGGLDSCVLLHLLRFGCRFGDRLVVGHFDHAMRPCSTGDADWASGLARAWGLPFRLGRASELPRSEGAARDARYRFLHGLVRQVDGGALLTAHHADDQAETVLFRVLRGTGLRGLGGIPASRAPRLLRPLLDVWREELHEYAGATGLAWREDPTNRQFGAARNVIRHQLLPTAEARVAPGARRALVRLAEQARQNEAAWAEALPELVGRLSVEPAGEGWHSGISLDRAGLLTFGEELRGIAIRYLAGRVGVSLDDAALRRAVDFTSGGASGTGVDLLGSAVMRRELDRLVIGTSSPWRPDEEVVIAGPGDGCGGARIGGVDYTVRWTTKGLLGPEGAGEVVALDHTTLRFPLRVRGWIAGDRIDTPGGHKKLKKLFLESRIPDSERRRHPVLVDAGGRVVWVVGVGKASGMEQGPGAALEVRVSR
jgi:tRNA(Ile)-lysidine synthetase-like protein